jgi:hypothetical protein
MDTQERDKALWHVAKKRAAFKMSFISYIVINLFLIGIWYYSSDGHSNFWPGWVLAGWGIGITMQYFGAYHGNKHFSAEEEYEKLKKQKQSQF